MRLPATDLELLDAAFAATLGQTAANTTMASSLFIVYKLFLCRGSAGGASFQALNRAQVLAENREIQRPLSSAVEDNKTFEYF
jgi:hypothetical protein